MSETLGTPTNLLIDIFFFGLILLFVVAERFAQWPEADKGQFSGSPREYIDSARYSLFLALYLLTFLLFITVLRNLGSNVVFQLMDLAGAEPVGLVQGVMGEQSYTFTALALIALMNVPRVNHYDEIWRSKLQTWARIPKAVEDVMHQLRAREESFQPEPLYLDRLFQKMRGLPDAEYWQQVADNLAEERKRDSLTWRFVKASYLLLVIKGIGVSYFSREDSLDAESRLDNIAHVVPRLEENSDLYAKTLAELDALEARLYEALCKFVVRKYSKRSDQYTVLKNYGLFLDATDSRDIQLLEPAVICVAGIAVVCAVTVFLYLGYRSTYGGSEGGIPLDTWLRWSVGSLLSYLAAILTGLVFDRVSQAQESTPGLWVYVVAMLTATIASYLYFNIIATDPGDRIGRHVAFWALAMSFGSMSVVVINSLSTDTFGDKREILQHAVKMGLILGLLSGALQVVAIYGFSMARGGAQWQQLAAGFGYGFIRGGAIAIWVAYIIQENVRRQLVAALRRSPRRRHLAQLPASDGERELSLIITNISRTGLRVRARGMSGEVKQLQLRFPFANIKADVVWRQGHTAGLVFDRSDPNLPQLKGFIRSRYGEFYA